MHWSVQIPFEINLIGFEKEKLVQLRTEGSFGSA
jgi:hypothetical protein